MANNTVRIPTGHESGAEMIVTPVGTNWDGITRPVKSTNDFHYHFEYSYTQTRYGNTTSAKMVAELWTERSVYDNNNLLLAGHCVPRNGQNCQSIWFGFAYNYNGDAYTAGRGWMTGYYERPIGERFTQWEDEDLASYSFGFPWYTPYPSWDTDAEFFIQAEFPIFETEAQWRAYIISGGTVTDGCINIGENYEEGVTDLFHIYNRVGTAKLTYGNETVLTEGTWQSMKFYANSKPCFYFVDDTGFNVSLLANNVVSSIGMNGPSYLLDNVPDTQWREGELFFTSGFYANIDAYKDAFDKIPSNSTYTYGTTWDTDIPIFKNSTDANGYIDGTVSIDKAINYQEIMNKYPPTNNTGTPELTTQFGQVYTRAFFSQMYLCSANAVQEVSNALFDYDVPTLSGQWTAIKIGLEMYGTNPMEVIQNLRYYPFDLSQCFSNALDQNYLWIGAYNLPMTNNVKKVIYPNGYIDLGSLDIKRTFGDWRDFEPYTKCSVYLPYVGRFPINLAKYYDKHVNIRYFIDIRSGACCACLIADGVLLDWFDGIIGTDMPITLTDYSNFATSQINCIMRNMGLGVAGEAAVGSKGVQGMKAALGYQGEMQQVQDAARQTPLTSSLADQTAASNGTRAVVATGVAGVAALGLVAVGTAMKTTFDIMRDGIAGYTNGRPSSSSMINQYLPQYAMFIFEYKEIDESDYLNELYGRPSNKSGPISSFSGYLEAEDVMLICPIATDNERQEIIDLVRSGIYL